MMAARLRRSHWKLVPLTLLLGWVLPALSACDPEPDDTHCSSAEGLNARLQICERNHPGEPANKWACTTEACPMSESVDGCQSIATLESNGVDSTHQCILAWPMASDSSDSDPTQLPNDSDPSTDPQSDGDQGDAASTSEATQGTVSTTTGGDVSTGTTDSAESGDDTTDETGDSADDTSTGDLDCQSDADCLADPTTSICNTASGKCVQCLVDEHCSEPAQICDPSNFTCQSVECVVNSDCPDLDRPICSEDNSCEPCTRVADQCSGDAACDPRSGRCMPDYAPVIYVDGDEFLCKSTLDEGGQSDEPWCNIELAVQYLLKYEIWQATVVIEATQMPYTTLGFYDPTPEWPDWPEDFSVVPKTGHWAFVGRGMPEITDRFRASQIWGATMRMTFSGLDLNTHVHVYIPEAGDPEGADLWFEDMQLERLRSLWPRNFTIKRSRFDAPRGSVPKPDNGHAHAWRRQDIDEIFVLEGGVRHMNDPETQRYYISDTIIVGNQGTGLVLSQANVTMTNVIIGGNGPSEDWVPPEDTYYHEHFVGLRVDNVHLDASYVTIANNRGAYAHEFSVRDPLPDPIMGDVQVACCFVTRKGRPTKLVFRNSIIVGGGPDSTFVNCNVEEHFSIEMTRSVTDGGDFGVSNRFVEDVVLEDWFRDPSDEVNDYRLRDASEPLIQWLSTVAQRLEQDPSKDLEGRARTEINGLEHPGAVLPE